MPHFEATATRWSRGRHERNETKLTKDFVAAVVFADKIPQNLLIHSGAIRDSGVPERAAQLKRPEEDGFSLFVAEVSAEGEADTHGAEAGDGDVDALDEREGLDHVSKDKSEDDEEIQEKDEID